jgi:hypothetical protein
MATIDEVMTALAAADKAGNVADAQQLAAMANSMRNAPTGAGVTVQGAPSELDYAQPLPMPTDAEISSGSYLANSARLAPISGVSSLYGLFKGALNLAGIDPTVNPIDKITEMFTKPVAIDPRDNTLLRMTGAGQIMKGEQVPAIGQVMTAMQPGQQEALKALAPLTGARTDMAAPNLMTQIGGAAIQTALDPTALFTGAPMALSRVIPTVASRVPGLGVVGGASELGGEVGAQVEKAITGEDTGAGRAMAAFTTGGVVAAKGTAVREGAATGANAIKQAYDKYKDIKADPAAAEQAMATGAAKRLLKQATLGMTEADINKIVTDYNKISNKITGADAPLFVAMADNPTIQASVANLVKTDPVFRKRYETELGNIVSAMDNNAGAIFGTRYTPIVSPEFPALRNTIKARQKIDTELETIGDRFVVPDEAVDVGTRITQLKDAQLATARSQHTIEYDALKLGARKAGVKLPEEGVKNIHNFVKLNRLRDVFGKGTAVDTEILKQFEPKNNEFYPVNFDTVISLKEEINRLQRGRLDPKEGRLLMELENVLNKARESIPGKWNQQLLDVDKSYYENVGVPFSAQGIKEIDSRKYAEQVAPVVVKNASSFNQFRAVVGEEANIIGRNALLSEAYDKTVKNGTLSPNTLRAFITKKGAVIDEIPGLRQEFNGALLDDQVLKTHKATLDADVKAAEKRLSDNFIAQSVDPRTGEALPGYNQVLNNMLQNRANLVKVKAGLTDVDPTTSKAVKNALKAEFINKAREYPDGGIKFLTDVKNKDVVEFLYGMKTNEGKQVPGLEYNTFRKSAEDLLRLSDAAQQADISKINVQVSQKNLDSVGQALTNYGLPGLDAPFLASTIRDRISSMFQKGVRLLSRVNEARTRDATNAAYEELLLDPAGMKKLSAMANEIKFDFKNPASIQRFVDTMTDVFPRYMYGTLNAGAQEPVQVTPEEMVFGGFEGQ